MTDKPKRAIIWAAVSSLKQGLPEKESIPQQLARQRALASEYGLLVVDEIIVEHSRDFLTYAEFSQSAASEGFPDPMRMWDHWQNKSFDILICRELDRIGREQSITAEFISRCIKANAEIWQLESSNLDKRNYRRESAFGGMSSAEYVDRLKRYRSMGMIGRAKAGQTLSSQIPMFYKVGGDDKLIPDRDKYQRFFDDLADLFLDGTPYALLPAAMAERGHTRANGKPYHKAAFQTLLTTARTWGHASFNRTGAAVGGDKTRHLALWPTGRGLPPDGVFFERDVCEPIWDGQLKNDMIDELERRTHAIRGGAQPKNTYALSMLCVCADCKNYMSVQKYGTWMYITCHRGRLQKGTCNNRKSVRYSTVQEFVDLFLARLQSSPDAFLSPPRAQTQNRADDMEKNIDRLNSRIDALMDVLSEAPMNERAQYQTKITALIKQRDDLKTERLKVIAIQHESEHAAQSRITALKSIHGKNVWEMNTTAANQLLRKILGDLRIFCQDGEVVGLEPFAG